MAKKLSTKSNIRRVGKAKKPATQKARTTTKRSTKKATVKKVTAKRNTAKTTKRKASEPREVCRYVTNTGRPIMICYVDDISRK